MNRENAPELFQITTDRMFTALAAFYVWKKMNMLININEDGEERAVRNIEIFRKYWDFFSIVKNSTYKSFVTDLSIFFDPEKYPDTFSLQKLINVIKDKISRIEYIELIKEIKAIKKKHGVSVAFILELRNVDVSHQEIARKERLIVYKEIEELFSGVQEILNLLSKYYDNSFTIWDHIEDNVTSSIEWVLDNLERGEKVRLDKIIRST